MLTKDFDYHLPMERIAQKPIEPRDQSNLMLINKHSGFGRIKHKKFVDIVDEFKKGDLIVWNSSKVFKARLFGELLSGEGQQLMDHKKR